ncbi:MAG: FGGY-family carbohydrate kinase [Balneola sp.]
MYLVINLGLKSIRGIIFNSTGDQLYSVSYPVHTTLYQKKVEQDPKEWKDLLNNILGAIKNKTDLSREIKYISVTTSSSCILGVDKEVKPVTPVMMVSDKRAEDISVEIASSPVYKKVNKIQKITCATSSLVPKAVWYKRNDTDIFNEIRYWMGAGEFLSHFFTKEIFSDPLNAGKSFYSSNEYNKELLNHFGINEDTLPPVVEIGELLKVDKTVIDEFSLSIDCKFVVCTYDAICAVLGSSTGEANNACDVSGTVTSVRLLSSEKREFSSNILLSQKLDFLNKFMIGASNNLGGGIIEWYKQAFFDEDDPDVYTKIERLANKSEIGSDGVIFLPYLLGERAPFKSPNASGSFFGLKRNSTIVQFSRAVLESTAFVTKDLIDLIETSGIEVKSLTVSGGLARFDLVNQIKADVCNVPVYVVDNFESTSIGAYLIMTMSSGLETSLEEALKKFVSIRKVIKPSQKGHQIYSETFKLYKKIRENFSDIYTEHSLLREKYRNHENQIVRNL